MGEADARGGGRLHNGLGARVWAQVHESSMRDAHLGVCTQDVRPAICKDLIRVRSRARVRAGASIRVTIGAAIREDR